MHTLTILMEIPEISNFVLRWSYNFTKPLHEVNTAEKVYIFPLFQSVVQVSF